MYVLNELLDTLQFICFLYIFFKENIILSVKKGAWISGIYVLCIAIMFLLHQEENLLILGTGLAVFLATLLLREKWYEKVLSFCLLFSLPGILVLSIETIGRYFMGKRNLAGLLTFDYAMDGQLITLLIAMVCVFYRHRSSEIIHVSNSSKAILSVISAIFMFMLAWMTRKGATVDDMTGLLVGLTSLTIVVAAVWILIIESSREKQHIRGEMVSQYLSYIGQLEKNQNEIRRINHDFHKHINALHLLKRRSEYDKLEEYLQTMGADMKNRYEDVGYTQNTMFNALISDKIHKGKEKGITITHKGTLGENLSISDYDLCTMVSNVMDNAMEYVERHDEKRVSIITYQDENSIVLTVTNLVAVGETINPEVTNKTNKEMHGLGLENVRCIAEKHQGELRLSQKDNLFSVSIILYYEKRKNL